MAEHSSITLVLLVAFAQAGFVSSRPENLYRHIWSRCDPLDREITGCTRYEPMTCAHRESPGPADADVEIHLAGLPESNQSNPVYLHFWAPRKYSQYKPLESPVGCMVYRDMLEAHPKYWDSDFNGGNVKVSGSGKAVIRVRAPSTYFVWRYIAIPQIRLRLCHPGVRLHYKPPDATIYFGVNGTWVTSDSKAHSIQVSTAAPYADRQVKQLDEEPQGPKPVARVVGVFPITATTIKPLSDREALINASRDALSLAALEYSPVYTCFLLGLFYDHTSEAECVEQCPANSEPAYGQCSRAASEATDTSIMAVWKLEVSCGSRVWCLPDSNRTLHMARLAVASHLAIPFQEVQVRISFTKTSSRRLLDLTNIYFKAMVNTRRLKQAHGARLLGMLIANVEFARELLDVDVRRIEILGDVPAGQQRIMEMNELNDPYSPAYQELRPIPKEKSSDKIFGIFTPGLLFGISGGFVVFASILGILFCFWRRKKARQAPEARAQERAQQNKNSIEENGKEAEEADVQIF